jgi:hypothetical protein
MIDRRDFFRFLGTGTAGIMVAPVFLNGCTVNGNGNEDNYVNFDGIMPIAMVTDCSSLLLASGTLSERIAAALKADINLPLAGNLSRLGSSIPFDDENVFDALQGVVSNWDQDTERMAKKLSLILGWVIFRPLKKSMTNIFQKLVDEGYHYDSIRSYFDTYLIRQFSGHRESFANREEDLQDLLTGILPRMITRLHTLKPDYKDGLAWVNRMSNWRMENVSRMEHCGTLIAEDDQDLYEHVIRKYNVYNPEDRLIALARSPEGIAGPEKVEQVILSDPGNSIYAKSLEKGYQNIQTVQDFIDGKIELGKMKKML